MEISKIFETVETDSPQLKRLKKEISEYFRLKYDKAESQLRKLRIYSVMKHTSRNILSLYRLFHELEVAPNTITISAMACHDIGRLREIPQGMDEMDWRKKVNKNHPQYSVEDSKPFLIKAGFSKDDMKYISYLIANHSNDTANRKADQDLKLVQIADSMDKFSSGAIDRIVELRSADGLKMDEIKKLLRKK